MSQKGGGGRGNRIEGIKGGGRGKKQIWQERGSMGEQDKQVIVGKSKEDNEIVATERQIMDLINLTLHPHEHVPRVNLTDY